MLIRLMKLSGISPNFSISNRCDLCCDKYPQSWAAEFKTEGLPRGCKFEDQCQTPIIGIYFRLLEFRATNNSMLELDDQLQRHSAELARMAALGPQPPSIGHRCAHIAASARYLARHVLVELEAPGVKSRDSSLDVPGRSIGLRTYRAIEGPRPHLTLVYCHGGGWVVGNLDSHDELLRHVTQQLGCTVIAVDYRLSPESRSPDAADDVVEVVRNVVRLSKDRIGSKVALGGDSAEAHIAAAATHNLEEVVSGLLLLYPVVRPDFRTKSYIERGQDSLTRDAMRWFWEQYLDQSMPTDAWATNDARIDLLLQRWQGAPPSAVVLTAWHDPLCDEGLAYAQALATAGATVHSLCAADMPHGFGRYCGVSHSAARHLSQALATFGRLIDEAVDQPTELLSLPHSSSEQ